MRASLAIACLLGLSACGGAVDRSLAATDAGPVDVTPASDAGSLSDASVPADAGAPAAVVPKLAGCPMFPLSNAWNRDVSAEPADPHSAEAPSGRVALRPGLADSTAARVVPSQSACHDADCQKSHADPPLDVPIRRKPTITDRARFRRVRSTDLTTTAGRRFHADSGAVFDLAAALTSGRWPPPGAGLLIPARTLARRRGAVGEETARASPSRRRGPAHAHVARCPLYSAAQRRLAPPMGSAARLRAGSS
jgi:hypothetical protein